jgi:hypothetical protein
VPTLLQRLGQAPVVSRLTMQLGYPFSAAVYRRSEEAFHEEDSLSAWMVIITIMIVAASAVFYQIIVCAGGRHEREQRYKHAPRPHQPGLHSANIPRTPSPPPSLATAEVQRRSAYEGQVCTCEAVIRWWAQTEYLKGVGLTRAGTAFPWFLGAVANDHSRALLRRANRNSFHVRLQNAAKGYVISVRGQRKIHSIPITVRHGLYSIQAMINSRIFPTLEQLVRHYRKNPIQVSGKPPVFLKQVAGDRGHSYRELVRMVQLLSQRPSGEARTATPGSRNNARHSASNNNSHQVVHRHGATFLPLREPISRLAPGASSNDGNASPLPSAPRRTLTVQEHIYEVIPLAAHHSQASFTAFSEPSSASAAATAVAEEPPSATYQIQTQSQQQQQPLYQAMQDANGAANQGRVRRLHDLAGWSETDIDAVQLEELNGVNETDLDDFLSHAHLESDIDEGVQFTSPENSPERAGRTTEVAAVGGRRRSASNSSNEGSVDSLLTWPFSTTLGRARFGLRVPSVDEALRVSAANETAIDSLTLVPHNDSGSGMTVNGDSAGARNSLPDLEWDDPIVTLPGSYYDISHPNSCSDEHCSYDSGDDNRSGPSDTESDTGNFVVQL